MSTKRILIVDDEPLLRRAMADYLAECGYETSTAADGAEGLAQARAEQFDVVLVDLRMPRVDGLEVIATLHAEQPELPIVVISGTGVLSDAIAAMRRGAWDYITKPIQDVDEIVVVVERVLERAHLVAERDRYQRAIEELNRSLEAEVARQTHDLRVQYRELAALNRVSYAISEPLDLDTALDRAIDAAIAAIEADGGIVQLLNPVTDQLVVAATRGLAESYSPSTQTIPLGQGIVGQVAKSGRPQVGSDFANDPWLVTLSKTTKFRSFLFVPLRASQEILGTLGAVRETEQAFDARKVELLASIGNQIGVTVARAQYAADLQRANAELAQANAELRSLDTLREQFIQNVAHELRTPLALAHGYVHLLSQGDLTAEEQQTAIDVVSKRMQGLANLIESITTLQDLDNEPLHIEPIMPAELIQTACRMAAQRASSAGIRLRNLCPSDLPAFPGDFTKLVQTLHQLLDNACKFSPEGSTVSVSLEMTETNIIISVVDEGTGIPSAEQSRIFDRFYQVDGSPSRQYGGIGLGLAIAREIVEAHGGEITVISTVGEGSTFTITLPLAHPSLGASGSPVSHA
jgi:signal transduction histidine kinase/DNA-binding response OmpR family regulator